MAAIARLASHAILLVETLANLATAKARERLLEAGFDNVTLLVAGRPDAAAPAVAPKAAAPKAAAAAAAA
jgi:hypothetical protein